MKSKKPEESGVVSVAKNRRALYDYEILERIECGIVLVGTEVKSLRNGHCRLEDAYAQVIRNELWLMECEIPEYTEGNRFNHKPKRDRKLLVHKRELTKLQASANHKGLTMVPLSLYFKNGRAKVEIAVAKGKQQHDKREALKKADAKREMDKVRNARG